MIVVDTNIIGYFYLASDYSEQVEKVYQRDSDWVAPLLWRSELRNVLASYIRKNIFSTTDAHQVMVEAESLLENHEYMVNSAGVLRLVAGSNCSAYDCEFVAVAQDLGICLVTMDQKILNNFPQIAMTPEQFLSQM